jgi:hypothetical protein
MNFETSKDHSLSRRRFGSKEKSKPFYSLPSSESTENKPLRSSALNSMSFKKIDDHFEVSQSKPLSTRAATERLSRRSHDKPSIERSHLLSTQNANINDASASALSEIVDKGTDKSHTYLLKNDENRQSTIMREKINIREKLKALSRGRDVNSSREEASRPLPPLPFLSSSRNGSSGESNQQVVVAPSTVTKLVEMVTAVQVGQVETTTDSSDNLFVPIGCNVEPVNHPPWVPPSSVVAFDVLGDTSLKDQLSFSSSSSSSSLSEEFIPLHELEEFASSLIEIVRSLFVFTEDLEVKLEYYLSILSSFLPASVQEFLHHISPVLKQLAFFVEIILTGILIIIELFVELIAANWTRIKAHYPHYLIGILFGFVFCFFGSFFFTTIAAFEAFRLFGYSRLLKALRQINDDLQRLKRSSRAFSVSLTKSISSTEEDGERKNHRALLLESAFHAFAQINPNHLFQAFFVLNTGLLAALTTLKIRFAKTVTLGNSISSLVEAPLMHVADPLISSIFPNELKEWGNFALRCCLRFFSISIAWTLQRFIASFHSSIRGGILISKNLLRYVIATEMFGLEKMHQANPNDTEDDKRKEVNPSGFLLLPLVVRYEQTLIYGIGYLLAAVGLIFQLTYRQSLPFPLNYLFSPILLVERSLMWAVNHSSFLFHNM